MILQAIIFVVLAALPSLPAAVLTPVYQVASPSANYGQVAFDPINQTIYFTSLDMHAVLTVVAINSVPLTPIPAPWGIFTFAGTFGTAGAASSVEVAPLSATFSGPTGIVGWPADDLDTSVVTAFIGLFLGDAGNNVIRFVNFLRGRNVTLVAGNGVLGNTDGMGTSAVLGYASKLVWARFVTSKLFDSVASDESSLRHDWTFVVLWSDGTNNCIRMGIPTDKLTLTPIDSSAELQDMVLNVTSFVGLCGTAGTGTGYAYRQAVLTQPSGVAAVTAFPLSLVGSNHKLTYNTTVVVFVGETGGARLSMIWPLFPVSARYMTVLANVRANGLFIGRISQPTRVPSASDVIFTTTIEVYSATLDYTYVVNNMTLVLQYSRTTEKIQLMSTDLNTLAIGNGIQRSPAVVRYSNATYNGSMVMLTGQSVGGSSTGMDFYCCLGPEYSLPVRAEDEFIPISRTRSLTMSKQLTDTISDSLVPPPEFIFETPRYAVSNFSLRLKMLGPGFNTTFRFRLTDNISRCDVAMRFAANSVPASTIGNVQAWTPHNSRYLFVADFFVGPYYGSQTYVCMSVDSGRRWRPIHNRYFRMHFQIFPYLPVATYAPKTIVVGRPLYVSVTDTNTSTFNARAILVIEPTGCEELNTEESWTRYHAAVKKARDGTYTFLPTATVSRLYLCVASADQADWTLVPFDGASEMVWQRRADKAQPETGWIKPYVGISVNPEIVAYRIARVTWTPALVAGMTATATITMYNKTGLALAAADFTVARVTDGSGTVECPPPVVRQAGAAAVTFSFVPQRAGREGQLSMTYKGYPLRFLDNVWNRAALRLPNSSKYRVAARAIDMGTTRFLVEPGFASLDWYAYASSVRLGWFAPLANWVIRRGVPAGANGTSAVDEQTATLKPGVTSGVITYNATVPAGATKCRVRMDYFYNATSFDYTTTWYVGRATAVARNASGADVATLKNFMLYVQGRTVVVTGGPRMNGMDGDVMSWERVGFDLLASSFATVRLELEVYHGNARTLLFGNPYFACSVHARTPPAEEAALQRIWTAVGSASAELQQWRSAVAANAFNADPCLARWRGVTCRNLRVVELDLSHSNLTGQFPPIPELSFLEHLDLRNNSLFGTFPKAIVNNSRLVRVYLGQNRISSIPPTAFAAATMPCLRVVDARKNSLTAFPYQLVTHPAIEQIVVSSNAIRGALTHFPASSVLRHLDVSRNSLKYYLPQLPTSSLVSADFSDNQFRGTVPKQWGELANALYLDVSRNQLNGTIPAELSNIKSAARMTFRGAENYFRGVAPNLPFALVDVRGNAFSCPLPLDYPFVRTTHLVGLDEMTCDNF